MRPEPCLDEERGVFWVSNNLEGTPMKPKLHDAMMADLTLDGKAPRTRKAYTDCLRHFAEFLGFEPEEASREDVARFIAHLTGEGGAAPSTLNVTMVALRFFFETTAERPEVVDGLKSPRITQRVPEILSDREVFFFLDSFRSLRHQTIATLLYATGMRLSEGLNITVDDIDADRGIIVVRKTKTRRPRLVRLSNELLYRLRRYWKIVRPPLPLLFPGKDPSGPLNPSTVQRAFQAAGRDAGLTKRVTPHVLRHTYATHMLEAGVDLYTVQLLLGHTNLRETLRYLHLSTAHLAGRPTPPHPLVW